MAARKPDTRSAATSITMASRESASPAETDRATSGPENRSNASRRILIVDDSEPIRRGLQLLLHSMGHQVDLAADAGAALGLCAQNTPDLAIIDLNLPDKSGMELVAELQERGEDLTFLVLTGHGSIDSAVEATRRGVFDYLEKPVLPARLRGVIDRALERAALRHEVQMLRRDLMRTGRLRPLLGHSEKIRELYHLIDQIAPTTATVLITGESGTGKEVIARTLHRLSPRAAKPFVAINCAAIPATLLESEVMGHEKGSFTGATATRAGCFEQAHEGTLFFDEIGDMPADLQSKLLRVLEDHRVRRIGGQREVEVDVRVIAATNADVERLLEDGRLRQDLYFRLNVFILRAPPLRERREDVPLLAEHFLEEFRAETRLPVAGFSKETLDLLQRHPWPGNVRELRNAIERAVIVCQGGEIQACHLPPTLRAPQTRTATSVADGVLVPIGASLEEAERALILETLKSCEGDKPRVASILGISLKTLYTRLHKYGVLGADGQLAR
jgi:DNA-binding NtrC family response regulator